MDLLTGGRTSVSNRLTVSKGLTEDPCHRTVAPSLCVAYFPCYQHLARIALSPRNGTTCALGQCGSESSSARGRFMKPITPEKSKLGFIGIGYMGRPIARRLLASAFKLTAYDRDRGKAQELVRYGGRVAH